MPRTSQLVLIGAGAALAALAGRRLLLGRDPSRLPKGVEEFPPRLVDKRYGATGASAPASDATGITTEHYLQ